MTPTTPTENTWTGGAIAPARAKQEDIGDPFAPGKPQTSCVRDEKPGETPCPADYHDETAK